MPPSTTSRSLTICTPPSTVAAAVVLPAAAAVGRRPPPTPQPVRHLLRRRRLRRRARPLSLELDVVDAAAPTGGERRRRRQGSASTFAPGSSDVLALDGGRLPDVRPHCCQQAARRASRPSRRPLRRGKGLWRRRRRRRPPRAARRARRRRRRAAVPLADVYRRRGVDEAAVRAHALRQPADAGFGAAGAAGGVARRRAAAGGGCRGGSGRRAGSVRPAARALRRLPLRRGDAPPAGPRARGDRRRRGGADVVAPATRAAALDRWARARRCARDALDEGASQRHASRLRRGPDPTASARRRRGARARPTTIARPATAFAQTLALAPGAPPPPPRRREARRPQSPSRSSTAQKPPHARVRGRPPTARRAPLTPPPRLTRPRPTEARSPAAHSVIDDAEPTRLAPRCPARRKRELPAGQSARAVPSRSAARGALTPSSGAATGRRRQDRLRGLRRVRGRTCRARSPFARRPTARAVAPETSSARRRRTRDIVGARSSLIARAMAACDTRRAEAAPCSGTGAAPRGRVRRLRRRASRRAPCVQLGGGPRLCRHRRGHHERRAGRRCAPRRSPRALRTSSPTSGTMRQGTFDAREPSAPTLAFEVTEAQACGANSWPSSAIRRSTNSTLNSRCLDPPGGDRERRGCVHARALGSRSQFDLGKAIRARRTRWSCATWSAQGLRQKVEEVKEGDCDASICAAAKDAERSSEARGRAAARSYGVRLFDLEIRTAAAVRDRGGRDGSINPPPTG